MKKKKPEAPRFQAYCERTKGVMFMPSSDWLGLASSTGVYVEIDLAKTPFSGLTLNPNYSIAVLKQASSDNIELEVYREDPNDALAGTPINLDIYSVYNAIPSTWVLSDIVQAASTDADQNLDDFIAGQTMFIKWASSDIADHHIPDFPAHVKAILKKKRSS